MDAVFEPNWPLYAMLAVTVFIFAVLPKLADKLVTHPEKSVPKD